MKLNHTVSEYQLETLKVKRASRNLIALVQRLDGLQDWFEPEAQQCHQNLVNFCLSALSSKKINTHTHTHTLPQQKQRQTDNMC